jgi:hypothetical protein
MDEVVRSIVDEPVIEGFRVLKERSYAALGLLKREDCEQRSRFAGVMIRVAFATLVLVFSQVVVSAKSADQLQKEADRIEAKAAKRAAWAKAQQDKSLDAISKGKKDTAAKHAKRAAKQQKEANKLARTASKLEKKADKKAAKEAK